jgi:membrane protein required for colicin V production
MGAMLAELNWADWSLIAIISFSALISVMRGFTKEAMSLIIWVAAFIIARKFHPNAQTLLEGVISDPSIRIIAAFAGLFVLTLLVGSIINFLLSFLVKITGLTAMDRVLGVVFGIGRGVVVCLVIVAVIRYTPWAQSPWWQESVVASNLTVLEQWSRSVLGSEVQDVAASITKI